MIRRLIARAAGPEMAYPFAAGLAIHHLSVSRHDGGTAPGSCAPTPGAPLENGRPAAGTAAAPTHQETSDEHITR